MKTLREQKVEKLAVAMNVTVGDVNSFIEVLSYELQNGAANLEEAIEISAKKFHVMLKESRTASGSENMRKIVAGWFYGVAA